MTGNFYKACQDAASDVLPMGFKCLLEEIDPNRIKAHVYIQDEHDRACLGEIDSYGHATFGAIKWNGVGGFRSSLDKAVSQVCKGMK